MDPKTKENGESFDVFIELGLYKDDKPAIMLIDKNGIDCVACVTINIPDSFADISHKYINIDNSGRESSLEFLERYDLIEKDPENIDMYDDARVFGKDCSGYSTYVGVILKVDRLIEILADMPEFERHMEILGQAGLLKEEK